MNPLEIPKCSDVSETVAPQLQKLQGQHLVLDKGERYLLAIGFGPHRCHRQVGFSICASYRKKPDHGLFSDLYQGASDVFHGILELQNSLEGALKII